MLKLQNISSYYGESVVVKGISMEIAEGSFYGILGKNGMGKTTLLKTMMGLMNKTEGNISLGEKDLTKLSTSDRAKSGLGYVPQGRGIMPQFTVEENMVLGTFARNKNETNDVKNDFDFALELFPILKEKKSQIVGELSGGQRQQVALGRALMIRPSVLMLDEPTAGVSPIVMDELFQHIIKVKETNVAIIMVEQNAKQALSISNRGYVLVTGQNKFEGSGKELLNDPEVRRSFLGA